MWLFFGAGAILAALWNLARTSRDRDASWPRFVSLSLTALTVCAFYTDGAQRVLHEDWGGLMDIMPTLSWALWVCVIASIAVNGFSLVVQGRKQSRR